MSDELKEDKPNGQDIKYSEKVISDANPELEKLVGDMPNVVDEAVAAAGVKEAETEKINHDFKDKKGRPFDPSQHEIDPSTGQPFLTPTGRFKRKINLPKDKTHFNLPEGGQQSDPVMAQIKLQAGMWADAFIHLGMTLAGDEWKPDVIDGKMTERDLLVAANERYMIENGIVQLPAWAELALAYTIYAAKRFTRPKTQTIVVRVWGNMKIFFSNMWLKMTGKDIRVKPAKEADK